MRQHIAKLTANIRDDTQLDNYNKLYVSFFTFKTLQKNEIIPGTGPCRPRQCNPRNCFNKRRLPSALLTYDGNLGNVDVDLDTVTANELY